MRNWRNLKPNSKGKITISMTLNKQVLLEFEKIEERTGVQLSLLLDKRLREFVEGWSGKRIKM